MKTVLEIIADERERQKSEEGFSPKHDDGYISEELAAAAACYAAPPRYRMFAKFRRGQNRDLASVPVMWPWDSVWWKPKDRKSDIIRACALLVAEYERIVRREEYTLKRNIERRANGIPEFYEDAAIIEDGEIAERCEAEALRNRVTELESALKPFADAFRNGDDSPCKRLSVRRFCDAVRVMKNSLNADEP